MKFSKPELETTFEVPEPLTLDMALRYDSEVELNTNQAQMYPRLWRGVQALAANWQSPHIEITAGTDEPMTARGLAVIKWAALALFGYMYELKDIPKN